ncbi:MAG: acyltransferase [Eubacteriales bacterium]|nr:acyltransferase [Eubacteriales bacterium]
MDGIKYTELMGENVLPLLKYCGKNVRVFQLSKIINPHCAEIDDNSIIYDFVFIDANKSFKMGKHSCITWHCLIEGASYVEIGDRCFLGPGTKILGSTYEFNGYYTSEHIHPDVSKIRYGKITIMNDAYLGANCVVMPGVTIGEGALVGAGAFVNSDLEPWGIYVGSPARKIGEREKPTEERRKIVEAMDWTRHF